MWENRGITPEHGQQKVSSDRTRFSDGIYGTTPEVDLKKVERRRENFETFSQRDKFP